MLRHFRKRNGLLLLVLVLPLITYRLLLDVNLSISIFFGLVYLLVLPDVLLDPRIPKTLRRIFFYVVGCGGLALCYSLFRFCSIFYALVFLLIVVLLSLPLRKDNSWKRVTKAH